MQAWDRYAYANNAPTRYTDPNGHFTRDEIKDFLKHQYGKHWEKYLAAWEHDKIFWGMLAAAELGDKLWAPTTMLGEGSFNECEGQSFCFSSETGSGLEAYQGKGPYSVIRNGLPVVLNSQVPYQGQKIHAGGISTSPTWIQPIYNYSSGYPVSTNSVRVVNYNNGTWAPTLWDSDGLPWAVTGGASTVAMIWEIFSPIPEPVSIAAKVTGVLSVLGYANNSLLRYERTLTVSEVPLRLEAPLPLPTLGPNFGLP